MERLIHDLSQGSDAWHQFRLDHFGASEAAAMLGLSPKVKRNELLRAKHTGIAKEFSAWVQENILDHGHEVEALARPLVESRIQQTLYPATYSYGRLSASCDGLTMGGDIAFEHKQWNAALAAALDTGTLPEEYWPQCQQVLYVTGAERLIFVCSDGTHENFRYLWVDPDPDQQQSLVAGWAQFEKDLAEYQHIEYAEKPTAKPITDLPALTVELVGRVTSTNLEDWQIVVKQRIQAINTNLQTDQDFADAEKTVKFLDDGEKKLELVKEQALAQTASIDELFRAIDNIKAEMRCKRLDLSKTIEKRKIAIRAEIEARGNQALITHIAACNRDIGAEYMPAIPADFAAAMKGKKTVASLNDAVDTLLACAKIDADAIAQRIKANLATLDTVYDDYAGLFADLKHIVAKQQDDFAALVKLRIAEHKEREAKRQADDAARAAAAPAPTAPSVAPAPVSLGDVAVATAKEVFKPAAAKSADWMALRNQIDDELRTMNEAQLQQVLDFCNDIRPRRAA